MTARDGCSRAALSLMLACVVACSARHQTSTVTPLPRFDPLPYASLLIETESDVADDIGQDLSELVAQLIEGVNRLDIFAHVQPGDMTAGRDDALLVRISITGVRKVSREKQSRWGALAGRAHVTADVDVLDAATGEVLGAYTIKGESGGVATSGGMESAIAETARGVIELIETCCAPVPTAEEVRLRASADRPPPALPHREGTCFGVGLGVGSSTMNQHLGALSESASSHAYQIRLQLGRSLSERVQMSFLYRMDVHEFHDIDPHNEIVIEDELDFLAELLVKQPMKLFTNHVTLTTSITYHLKSTTPSLYLSGGPGLSFFPTFIDNDGLSPGLALAGGVGYERWRGWQAELELVYGTSSEVSEGDHIDRDAVNVTLSLQRVWY